MTDASNISCLPCWDTAIDPADGNWCRECCWDQRVGRDDVGPLPTTRDASRARDCPAGCGGQLMEDESPGPCFECAQKEAAL